ncbi:MAG: hypothetical protein B7Y56_00045 [Gallionellales bacterium 35-53-114]|nr:MAG: hypothetical protein B7Y56_00045 [Gallionellales bacterium 35-53-114]OYZ62230.1 MAG: hypothetical protein B7Y04_14680 [Gallionellales bacterium 24-53-125]OZB10649.1 MAG: hypothetical protein B7X61_03865 [Gallionellales bacterium 39-52-133]HQS57284.1 STAS domain-containing protein [Gallionellaceae bacterium]HQS74528.1 STAS domain-containing protein [Gallionellaceae bacterium]
MITRKDDSSLLVSGDVTMATVSALFREDLKLRPENAGSNTVVDFAQLEKVDSSAVSLMLVWLREAQRNKIDLRFANVPANLMSLAKLYGVAELLPLGAAE